MPIVIDPQLQSLKGWVYRMQSVRSKPGRPLLLLHGFSGDENSMWIFTRRLPAGMTQLAPRAPFPAPGGGYSWTPPGDGDRPLSSMRDLQPAVDWLLTFVEAWAEAMALPVEPLDVMGFSQGAALALALALVHPGRVRALAVLSGFLPSGADQYLEKQPLTHRSIFVAHGRKDDRIPIGQARTAVQLLQDSGARVTYCEADTGHKVSADCILALESYFISIL